MKLFWVYSCLLATTLSTLGLAATILIDPIPSTVNVNDVVVVTWSLDQHYVSDHFHETRPHTQRNADSTRIGP